MKKVSQLAEAEVSSASTSHEDDSPIKKRTFLQRVLAVEKDYYRYRNVGYLVAIALTIGYFIFMSNHSKQAWP